LFGSVVLPVKRSKIRKLISASFRFRLYVVDFPAKP
jgi:hypothetical protein